MNRALKLSLFISLPILITIELAWSHLSENREIIYINKSKASYTQSKSKTKLVIKKGIFANKPPRVEMPDGKRWTQLKAGDTIIVNGKERVIYSITYDEKHKRYVITLYAYEPKQDEK